MSDYLLLDIERRFLYFVFHLYDTTGMISSNAQNLTPVQCTSTVQFKVTSTRNSYSTVRAYVVLLFLLMLF